MILAYRYLHLTQMIQELKPRVILEVGTYAGERAIQMVRASGNQARYIGFDLFSQATAETDEEEGNAKKDRFTREQVEARLMEAGLDCELIQGNTRTTLPDYVKGKEPFVDFAFIDGGHSLTTIRSDWAAVRKILKPDGVAVFDDYYTVDPKKRGGCGPVVAKLDHRVLPIPDIMKDGTKVHVVRVNAQ